MGDRAVYVEVWTLDGSPIDYRVVAQIQAAIHRIVWGSGLKDLAWDIQYVEAS